jgi:uncharacterized membrane protein YcaP (DUF421 family)
MDAVARVAFVYFFLLLLFRLAGRRTLADLSPFDFVVVLIMSEMVQQAVVGGDASLTHASILCASLVGLDIGLSLLKRRSRRIERWLEGVPVVLVEHGRPLADVMRSARVDEEDVLSAARRSQGLDRMDQIRFAVLEKTGGISIVPETR